MYEGCLLNFGIWQSANWEIYCKAWHFWDYTYSERFDIRALFVVYSNLRDSSRTKNGIKSWTFSCDYFLQRCIDNNSALMNLIQFLAMKLHKGPVFIDGMVKSTEVVVHSKSNFVKAVQNQLLFPKPLMLCANWYCKIVMWPIMRLRQL